jgi:hypothetical protein
MGCMPVFASVFIGAHGSHVDASTFFESPFASR